MITILVLAEASPLVHAVSCSTRIDHVDYPAQLSPAQNYEVATTLTINCGKIPSGFGITLSGHSSLIDSLTNTILSVVPITVHLQGTGVASATVHNPAVAPIKEERIALLATIRLEGGMGVAAVDRILISSQILLIEVVQQQTTSIASSLTTSTNPPSINTSEMHTSSSESTFTVVDYSRYLPFLLVGLVIAVALALIEVRRRSGRDIGPPNTKEYETYLHSLKQLRSRGQSVMICICVSRLNMKRRGLRISSNEVFSRIIPARSAGRVSFTFRSFVES